MSAADQNADGKDQPLDSSVDGGVPPCALPPMSREELLRASLRQKEAMRDRFAKLPFEEKIRILVEMQKRAAVILAQRGITRPVWPWP